MQKRFSPSRRSQSNKSLPINPDCVYAYYKIMWQAAHPDATPEQYTAAMQKLAKEAGV